MATAQPLPNVVHHDDALHDLRLWVKRQVLRIEDLSKQQVLFELQDIMEGNTYSWHCINEFLQAQFDQGSLDFSLVDGDILFEWNNLCDEKRVWEKKGRLSINNTDLNMDCLINLKILPVQAGLGIEDLHLVTVNVDKPNVSTLDLWAGPKDPESLGLHAAVRRYLADDDTSSSDPEDGDYVDEGEETDDEGIQHKDMKMEFDDEDIDEDESDEERNEDEDIEGLRVGVDNENLWEDLFNEEKIRGLGDSSDELDEMEPEDEDVEGLGLKIVDMDEDEISDFEL